MTSEQRARHRDGIIEQYKKKGFTSGYEMFYNRHIHPSKWDDLQKVGVIKKLSNGQKFTYKDDALISEVIVIGRVRKLVYHPSKSNYFHTSIIVLVDEWLRDDFNLNKRYNEIVIKYVTGPSEGGHWISASHEPPLHIGEKLLLFLSRDGYIGDLVWNGGHYSYSKDDFIPNAFVAMGSGRIFSINESDVIIGPNGAYVSLKQIRADINAIVKILDVQNFYKNY